MIELLITTGIQQLETGTTSSPVKIEPKLTKINRFNQAIEFSDLSTC
jgi:hypothetical protein